VLRQNSKMDLHSLHLFHNILIIVASDYEPSKNMGGRRGVSDGKQSRKGSLTKIGLQRPTIITIDLLDPTLLPYFGNYKVHISFYSPHCV